MHPADHEWSQARNPRVDSLEEWIEVKSRATIAAFRNHTMHEPEMYCLFSPSLQAEFDNTHRAKSADAHIAWLETLSHKYPQWEVRIVNTSTSVDEKAGTAVCWMTLAATGLPFDGFENVARESVFIATWERVVDESTGKQKWWMVHHRNIRGPGRSAEF
jgi:hypothetical protein